MEADVAVAGQPPKKRTFKKFSFRGVDLDALLDMSTDDLVKLFTARARRRFFFFSYISSFIFICFRIVLLILCVEFCRFQRGLKRKPMALIKKLRKAVTISLYLF